MMLASIGLERNSARKGTISLSQNANDAMMLGLIGYVRKSINKSYY